MTAARSAAALLSLGLLLGGCSEGREPAAASRMSSAPHRDGDRLGGRATAVTLDAAFLRALAALRVAPSAAGSASLRDGVLVLPVTGGELRFADPRAASPRQVLGRVLHGGGLQLTGPNDTVVRLDDLELDPDQSRVYGALVVDDVVVAERIDAFAVDVRDMLPVRPGEAAGLVVLQGSRWALTEAVADALTTALDVEGFQPGLALGVAETTVQLDR
ncbi:MAG: hypothetical protein ACLGIG_12025 [Actinomycetes bacterium]